MQCWRCLTIIICRPDWKKVKCQVCNSVSKIPPYNPEIEDSDEVEDEVTVLNRLEVVEEPGETKYSEVNTNIYDSL